MRTARPEPSGFAAKAKDLQALRDAVDQAASVSGALWISYLFVFLLSRDRGRRGHAQGSVFREPGQIAVPQCRTAADRVFRSRAAAVSDRPRLHAAAFRDAGRQGRRISMSSLKRKSATTKPARRLRRQLPSNIFVQFLAGPRDVRTGVYRVHAAADRVDQPDHRAGRAAGVLSAAIPALSRPGGVVVAAHRRCYRFGSALGFVAVHRARHETPGCTGGISAAPGLPGLLLVSVIPALLVFTVATFPGEWLHELSANAVRVREWTPHKLLVAGEVDAVAQRPTSLWSNRLVLPGIDLREQAKFDTEAKIDSRPTTLWLRGRRLEDAILEAPIFPRRILPARNLKGALHAFSAAAGRTLVEAQLQGASLYKAQLQGASLVGRSCRVRRSSERSCRARRSMRRSCRARCSSRRSFRARRSIDAQLQGASLDGAQLQGASLTGRSFRARRSIEAQLQGASLDRAQLQGASLDRAQLQGARLTGRSFRARRSTGRSFRARRSMARSFRARRSTGAASRRLAGRCQLQGASLQHIRLEG